MKYVFGLVGVAAFLFLLGGVGTVAAFIAHAHDARVVFQWIFLAGLVPTMFFLVFSLCIGGYHLYLNRVLKRMPSGWFVSEQKGPE